jgi:IS30 family transposase
MDLTHKNLCKSHQTTQKTTWYKQNTSVTSSWSNTTEKKRKKKMQNIILTVAVDFSLKNKPLTCMRDWRSSNKLWLSIEKIYWKNVNMINTQNPQHLVEILNEAHTPKLISTSADHIDKTGISNFHLICIFFFYYLFQII